MARIFPFKGTHFNKGKVGNFTQVTTLPYDRVTPELQEKYYSASDYNIVRIIKGREFPDDTPDNNIYTRAGETLKQWLESRVLVEDPEPAIYVYHQEFTAPDGQAYVRKGMTVLVELEDYSSGKVKPHERTLSAPKEDRFKLLTHTDTHFGQIFQLYPDDENRVMALLDPHTERPPDMMAHNEEEDVVHKMWAVSAPDVIAAVQREMKDRLLFIADGHHRYETAINYRDYRLREYVGGKSTQNPRNAMVTMVSMSDKGLVVLPTHRVLHSLTAFDLQDFLRRLGEFFAVEERPDKDATLAALSNLAENPNAHVFGLYHKGKFWFLQLKDADVMTKLAPDHSAAWRSLDVAILHEVVLEHILGITKEAQAAKTNLNYERHPDIAIARVDKGTHQFVLLMNPTKLAQIREVAGGGEVMPQKSTDFFPKLITGLVCARVDLGERK
ncbi:DUF1015 domain-containing protein [bacterium]|nr:DUF1015 domain-containing protein [bacterium]